MSKLSDQEFLLADQYKNASNLDARIRLHRRFSTNTYGWTRWVFDQIDLPSKCRILELGCGPGGLWCENLDRIPAGWDITLTDFSPGMVEEAQESLSSSGRTFAFEIVDAQSIPYESASFDAVVANHMLYHIPNRAKALAEIRRVLRPGGKLYASTVGESHMRELDELVARFDTRGESLRAHTTTPFSLENGAEQLTPWLSVAALHRYEDSLIITEVKPLVDYVMSMVSAQSVFEGSGLAEFTNYVEQELAAHGTIHISKDSGMFEALRSDMETDPGEPH
jgi:ubiquinone/menaquinone biosynthesis C-methylase UbiE